MTEASDAQRLATFLLGLQGGDPYEAVYRASNEHREAHGPECGVYPSDPLKARLLATLVHATAARHLLEIGGGLGYSALWLADAAGPDGHVDTLDRFPEHVALARHHAGDAGLAARLNVIEGEGANVLPTLPGPYDLIHDEGWFGAEPPYFERMIDLLRPGGLLVASSWFLLEATVTGVSDKDWSQFAGPDWAANVQAYARKLAAHPKLHTSFVLRSWMYGLALAVKLP